MARRNPVSLTRTRVNALLAMAGRGADDVIWSIQDDYGVDITKTPEEIRQEIRAQAKEFPDLIHTSDQMRIWSAVHELQQYQAARFILVNRYIP